jgi:hypothetical protein
MAPGSLKVAGGVSPSSIEGSISGTNGKRQAAGSSGCERAVKLLRS